MKPFKHLSCSLLQKKLTVYSLKQFHTQKKSTLNVCEAPKEYEFLLWWVVPQTSKDLMQNTSPVFKNSHTSPYNYVIENTDYLKQALENYRYCWNSRNGAKDSGWGAHQVCIIMTHWYVTHPFSKSPLQLMLVFVFTSWNLENKRRYSAQVRLLCILLKKVISV